MRQTRQQKRAIEFCGIPGGGKSTLIREYIQQHQGQASAVTIDMYRRIPELYYGFLFAIQQPILFIQMMYFASKYHMKGLLLYSTHLTIRACAKYARARYCSPHDVFIDEGLVHIICTIPGRPLGKDEIGRWLSRVINRNSATCIALSGNFHRFQAAESVVHPRVLQGDALYRRWQLAVETNTKLVHEWFIKKDVLFWEIPEKTSEIATGVSELEQFLQTKAA